MQTLLINHPVNQYLTLISKGNIQPNFYVSEPYLKLSGAKCYGTGGVYWIISDDWLLFPPLKENGEYAECGEKIWCDFEGYQNQQLTPTFMDYMYVFDYANFLDMSGGRWEVFRKNVRKWPENHKGWMYTSRCWGKRGVMLLIAEWLEKKGDDLQDGELLARYVLEDIPGVNRKYLYDMDRLVAINAWDENDTFINFRVNIVGDDGWLSEFSRYRFYFDPVIQSSGKLINDGGTVGKLGLELFKDKMNPLHKFSRMTWNEIPGGLM